MYTHNISLLFDNLDVISTGIKIKQHDTQSHKLIVSETNFANGDRAIIKFLRPDGIVVCDEFAYNDSKEYIICSAALAESGTVSAEISVYNGNTRITSHTFTFEVIPDINTDYIFAENDTLPIINSLLNNLENCVKKEIGKGLSTNDYDDSAKAAVDGLADSLADKADKDDMDAVREELQDKVSFTDYAADTKSGVVKVAGSLRDGLIVSEDGFLKIYPATETTIDNRDPLPLPITCEHLDYAVRSVKPDIQSSIPDTLSVNTIYTYGKTAELLSLTLPKGETGDFIQVDFYSGETPTTLSIQSAAGITLDTDLIPEANTMYSLYFEYGTTHIERHKNTIMGQTSIGYAIAEGWRFSYAAYPYTEV